MLIIHKPFKVAYRQMTTKSSVMPFVLGQVILEEAMRDSLLYAKPGEPSLVVQLHASKQLAQEQCQVLAQENQVLAEANRELKGKVRTHRHTVRCACRVEPQRVGRVWTRTLVLMLTAGIVTCVRTSGHSIPRHFETC